ncbi:MULTISPECIES: hypothetical protein [unclassified Microcoleus]|uniref:hypothetical protein n=1 Tax=unclassified Microcoleus TaxID=2642155 RepID=UPI002FD7740C
MPTIYELNYDWYGADETLAKVATTAVWSVWDCVAKEWSNTPKVTLRNTLLSGLHKDVGKDRFCIGEIPENTKSPTLLNPFIVDKTDRYQLDLASNSRNHGRFTFNLAPIGSDYYGGLVTEQWKRIIYGSILHTGCKHLIGREFNYVIVDDTARDANGNPQDDPVNKRHWNSGDSHAKASREFMEILGAGTVEFDTDEIDADIPIQFRIAAFKKWVAKGTIAYNPLLDESGYDLVIPWSSLKGKKPALGNYTDKLLCGLVFEAEKRTAKAGWMLFQWFKFETLEQDNIITKLREKCQKLAAATNSIQALAKELRIHQEEAAQEREQGDSIQSEAEYINTAMEIIKYDIKGRLLLHPYITGKVAERLRAVWLNLAKAAGVRFWSLMSQPDEYFQKYESTDENNVTTFTEKVFCAPGMAIGEYIVFCNPMRHWGDCQLWINRHEGTYAKGYGLMAASTKLMLNLGRDFDGDFVQLIASREYPALRDAIANFDKPPSVDKLPKMALPGTLQEVAINSMNDSTGIVASLLGRARGAGVEGIVLLIPPGGMQTAPTEMSIIDFLSQELQIAVDSLKSAYPNNDKGLQAVTDYLNTLGDAGKIPWLKDFKEDAVYLSRPCAVADDAIDTISRLVRVVNTYWRPAQLETNIDINSFENALFVGVVVDQKQTDFAFEQRFAYRAEMSIAIEWKNQNDGDTTKIREVSAKFQALKNSALEQLADANGEAFSAKSWAAAYWRAVHTNATELSTGSLVFNLFREEIVTDLQENPDTLPYFNAYNVHRQTPSVWSRGEWKGQNVLVRVVQRMKPAAGEVAARMELAVDMSFPESTRNVGYFPLGWIPKEYQSKVAIGETREMRCYTNGKYMEDSGQIITKTVRLYNRSLSQEQIDFLEGKFPAGLYKPEDFGLPPN